ncbi:MAG: hypothetical protein CMK00_07795, partial [Planctomycetes bacterium]|nr:hypothetical protein [Planctomycetota bacterium]
MGVILSLSTQLSNSTDTPMNAQFLAVLAFHPLMLALTIFAQLVGLTGTTMASVTALDVKFNPDKHLEKYK